MNQFVRKALYEELGFRDEIEPFTEALFVPAHNDYRLKVVVECIGNYFLM